MGWEQPRRSVLSKRRSMRRLLWVSRCRMILFTRNPSLLRVAKFVATLQTPEIHEGFEFFQNIILAHTAGFELVNVDSTVILERPKLKDYRIAIREKLAAALGLSLDRVSVKFKTAEKVGPVGEGKSAEAQAVVTLRRLDR